MQVSGAGIGATVSGLMKSEGVGAFYKGLLFAYGRELSYTSIKLGAYAPVRDLLGAGKDAPFYMKFLAGAITGGVGSVVGYVTFESFISSQSATAPKFLACPPVLILNFARACLH